jgi:hypothetical protein
VSGNTVSKIFFLRRLSNTVQAGPGSARFSSQQHNTPSHYGLVHPQIGSNNFSQVKNIFWQENIFRTRLSFSKIFLFGSATRLFTASVLASGPN